jgi:hypothetical protein
MPAPRLTANIAEIETQIQLNAGNTPLPFVSVEIGTTPGYAIADRFDLDPYVESGRNLTFRLANPAPVIEMLQRERLGATQQLRRAISTFVSNFQTAEREQRERHLYTAGGSHRQMLTKLQDLMKEYNFLNRISEGEVVTFSDGYRTEHYWETVAKVEPYQKAITAVGRFFIDTNTMTANVRFTMSSNSSEISDFASNSSRADWNCVREFQTSLGLEGHAKESFKIFADVAKVEIAKKVAGKVAELQALGYTVTTTIPVEELTGQVATA